ISRSIRSLRSSDRTNHVLRKPDISFASNIFARPSCHIVSKCSTIGAMKPSAVNSASVENAAAQAQPQGVGLLVKAFQILDLFGDERVIWTQSELARETGLARSTLSRLVRFLSG